jgi:hypothetical protein
MKSVIIVMAILALAAVRAFAGADRAFQGWSKDGTYWVEIEQDVDEEIVFCPAHPGVAPTWPAGLPKGDKDEKGCLMMTTDAYKAAKLPALETLIVAAQASETGPGGLHLVFKKVRHKGYTGKQIWIQQGKTKLKAEIGELEPLVELGDVFWRPDGSQVAIGRRVLSSKDELVESTIDVVDLGKLKAGK